MFNTNRQSLFVLLTFVGMFAALSDAHAFGRRCRCKLTPSSECVTESYIVHKETSSADANVEITGTAKETSSADVKVEITGTAYYLGFVYTKEIIVMIKDRDGNILVVPDPKADSGLKYKITIPGDLKTPGGIIQVLFRKSSSKKFSEPFFVSYHEREHVLHPILPE